MQDLTTPIKKLHEHIIKDVLSTIATYPKVAEQANLSRIAATTGVLKNKETAQLPKKIDRMAWHCENCY
ncbi:hypothetical protein V9Z57_04765 [Streptococcus suis]|uniref:hypothetical protein n=1 Tax=Streptococcus suis TaxID=1307 RepID=UPI0030102899